MIDEKKLIEEFREKAKGYDKDCGYWSKRGEHGNELLCAGKCNGIVQAIKIAENQPKVGEWIPCSERFPEKRDWYLCVFEEVETGFIGLPYIADYLMGRHTKYTTDDGWIIANCTDIEDGRSEYYKKLECIAWQPLPESYKPGKE